MPYIKQEDRAKFGGLKDMHPETAGELNFCISTLVAEYMGRKGLNYAQVNEVVGALECSKLEVYRRVAAPYEDTKISDNGDITYPKVNYGA
jgi:hypothetical protein